MEDSNIGGRAARDRAFTVPPLTNKRNNYGDGDGVFPPVPVDIEPPPAVDGGIPQGQTTDDPVDVVHGPAGAEDGVGDAHGAVGAGSAGSCLDAPPGRHDGAAGGAHEIGSSGGEVILPEPVMLMIRPFVSGSSGPVVAQGANTGGGGGGGGEYRFTLTMLTVTRSDNSDIESNTPGGASGGGGGGGGVAAGEGLADRGGIIPGQGGLPNPDSGGDNDVLGAVLLGGDIPDGGGRDGDDDGVRPLKADVLAVSTLLLLLTLLVLWLAGYAPTPEAILLVVFAALSLTIDGLHRLGIAEIDCMQFLGISGSAVEVGLYSFAWTCFALFGIGELVK
eukprot:g12006.t1